jgi:hypothetical protein
VTDPTPILPQSVQRRVPILAALGAGAIIGAIILGGGGRLAMRAITLWEDRGHQFSVSGSFAVIGWGAAFGAGAAALRLALETACARWLPNRTTEAGRAVAFAIIGITLGIVVLTPLTMHRLVLFPPLIVLYLICLEVFWRRAQRRRIE